MVEYQNREDIDKLLNLVEDIKYLIGYDENKVLASSDDVKEAINSLNQLINDEHYDKSTIDSLNDNLTDNITSLNDVVTSLLFRLGLSQDNNSFINFALVNRTESNVENIEFWILANAYYNYDDGYFYKMDMDNTSFGIQIQAVGTIFGEAELGYTDNSGIVVWRNPSLENLSWATAEQKRCLVERHIIGEYDAYENIETFYKSCGWNNAFLFDSYGGMTVGGTGFEIDGNGIFPYTRVANCLYTDENDVEYGYIALLHNAYNSTRYGWDCDSNRTYSWLMGIHAPVDTTLGGNNLDMTKADFRVMYNDTPYNEDDIHNLNVSNWHTILKVDLNSTTGMSNGSLASFEKTRYKVFDIMGTITKNNVTVYYVDIGDITNKSCFENGNLCTFVVYTNSTVTENKIRLSGTENGIGVMKEFTLKKDDVMYTQPLTAGDYVLCIMDVDTLTLKLIGVY